jgi:cell division septum initiation protein DivIVA
MIGDTPREEASRRQASDEIRSIELPRALRGYDRDAVAKLVTCVTEKLDGLEEQVGRLEKELVRQREQAERDFKKLASEYHELQKRMQQTAEKRDQLAQVALEATREREEIVATIEEINAERAERISYTQRLERELMSHRELESSLKHMVVAAERIGSDLRALSEHEATVLLEEARAGARRLLTDASTERDLIVADVRRIRSMLQAAQASLDERALFVRLDSDAKDTSDHPGAPGNDTSSSDLPRT